MGELQPGSNRTSEDASRATLQQSMGLLEAPGPEVGSQMGDELSSIPSPISMTYVDCVGCGTGYDDHWVRANSELVIACRWSHRNVFPVHNLPTCRALTRDALAANSLICLVGGGDERTNELWDLIEKRWINARGNSRLGPCPPKFLFRAYDCASPIPLMSSGFVAACQDPVSKSGIE